VTSVLHDYREDASHTIGAVDQESARALRKSWWDK
jgi:hypothetical protein